MPAGRGATFTNIDATHWEVNYNGGASHDIITFANGASIDATDFLFAWPVEARSELLSVNQSRCFIFHFIKTTFCPRHSSAAGLPRCRRAPTRGAPTSAVVPAGRGDPRGRPCVGRFAIAPIDSTHICTPDPVRNRHTDCV